MAPPRPLALALLLPLLAGCLVTPAQDDGGADLLLMGGRVWTNDPAQPWAEAVAVRGDRIAYVGSDAGAMALRGPATRVVPLDGAFVGPGFRDHHAHVLEVAAGSDPLLAAVAGDSENPFAPVFDPPNAAASAVGQQSTAAYHLSLKAQGQSPVDACRRTAPGPELKERLAFAQQEAAKQGLVAVTEAGLQDLGVLEALREMERDGELRVRFLVLVAWGCVEEAGARGLLTTEGPWVRTLGVKLYSDGWLGPRTAALREPYSDRPASSGVLFLEPDRATRDVARLRELGLAVGSHAIGDRGMEVMLDAYEAAGAVPADRWALEHVQVLAPDLLARMAAMGVVGTIQLSFATSDMGYAEDALGPERVRTAYAWRTAQAAGVRLAGSSDFPIEVLHPLWGLQRTVTRQELDGTPPGGWMPHERLPVEDALRLVTSDAAYASREDDRGRIAPGFAADLVVLREDLTAIDPARIAGATVLLTVVNGQVAFEGEQAYPPRARAATAAATPALAASAATKGATPSITASVSGT